MHPPGWICSALYRIHPHLRMAWAGRDRIHQEELNPGSFAVVQLYHCSDFGQADKPHTYREGWDLTVKPKPFGEPEFEPIYRGPIFNRWGGCQRDWDPLFRVPVFVATIDEEYSHKDGTPMGIQDVYTGSFLETIRWWLVPIKRRIMEMNREQGKELNQEAEDIGREATDFLWSRAMRPDAGYKPMAWKHAKKELASLDKLGERTEELSDYYNRNICGGPQ